MKLVGWTSLWVALMAGAAIAQVDMTGEESESTAGQEPVKVPSDVPQTHTVKEGDTLWDITENYYGDPYR